MRSWSPRVFLLVAQGREPARCGGRAAHGRGGPAQADLAIERLEVDARAAGPDHEIEAAAGGGTVEPDGEVGVELPREGRDADGSADVFGYRDGDVAVVAGEAVA